ncbi:MAG: hypothetical protein NUV97_00290 [archaeon]|nr:hypothetical protein [archaeon]MCR4323615.1 hypothetical protein [Nanoarchaeota archaeon]
MMVGLPEVSGGRKVSVDRALEVLGLTASTFRDKIQREEGFDMDNLVAGGKKFSAKGAPLAGGEFLLRVFIGGNIEARVLLDPERQRVLSTQEVQMTREGVVAL